MIYIGQVVDSSTKYGMRCLVFEAADMARAITFAKEKGFPMVRSLKPGNSLEIFTFIERDEEGEIHNA